MREPDSGTQVACDWCGTRAAALPLTWTRSVEGSGEAGRTTVHCDRCSREHLRAIEGKLDSAWW